MSINVTVKGNPVKIHHGKMVTIDSDYSKSEFDKRRKIRLEQVRQQSKDIAEDVRNKIKKEKGKQLSKLEQEGASKLKQWQNKKLLQLNTQYKECLKEIGLGHSKAVEEEKLEEETSKKREHQNEIAKDRGVKAAQRQKEEKDKKGSKEGTRSQQKTLSRDIENTRASMVSKIDKTKTSSKEKRRKQKKGNKYTNVVEDSADSGVPLLLNLSSSESTSSSGAPTKQRRHNSPSISSPTALSEISDEDSSFLESRSRPKTKKPPSRVPSKPESPKKTAPNIHQTNNIPFDTRISDRIKNRTARSEFNKYSSTNIENTLPDLTRKSSSNIINQASSIGKLGENVATSTKLESETKLDSRTNIGSKSQFNSRTNLETKTNLCSRSNFDSKTKLDASTDVNTQSEKYCGLGEPCYRPQQQELPYKPPVCLKLTQQDSCPCPGPSGINKVQYYDHSNKFSKEFIPSKNVVHKISEESIQPCPSDGVCNEFIQKMYQRDKQAHVRGKQAIEKEKIRKEFQEMMRKLPILQRQERVASITTDKEDHHMSDERLKEQERKTQNKIENAYEKSFPRKQIITLPKQRHQQIDSPNMPPFKTVDLTAKSTSTKATWDVLSHGQGITEGRINITSKEPSDLESILNRLKDYRECLLREVENLPDNSNLHKILNELSIFENKYQSTIDESKKAKKRKYESVSPKTTLQNDTDSSSVSSRIQTKLQEPSKANKHKHKKPKKSSTTSLATEDNRNRSKQRILVLQNMSTQTSPKVSTDALNGGPKEGKLSKPTSPTRKTFEIAESCECGCLQKPEKEKVCEIVIKITEDKSPEIVVSPRKTNNVNVRSEIPQVDNEKCKNKNIELLRQRTDDISHINSSQRPTSWAEYISPLSNKGTDPSSSTSYFSPPNFQTEVSKNSTPKDNLMSDIKSGHFQQNKAKFSKDPTFSDVLGKKPRQTNVPETPAFQKSKSNAKELDPRLKVYIRKLLSLTRKNIEDLAVSTGSDITTPGASIIGNETNNPKLQLNNVMKFFNLTTNDLRDIMNETDSTESSVFVSSATISDIDQSLHKKVPSFVKSAQNNFFKEGVSTTKDSFKDTIDNLDHTKETEYIMYPKHSPMYDALIATHELDINSTTNKKSPQEVASDQTKDKVENATIKDLSTSDYTNKFYPATMEKYAEIAELCHQRIQSLDKLIEQVRKEKKEILDTSPHTSASDAEVSNTVYKDIPSKLGLATNESSLNSTEQEELNKQLLDIDKELTKKLERIEKISKLQGSEEKKPDDIDLELIERYRKLFDQETGKKSPERKQINVVTITSPPTFVNTPFIPVLFDIPRLPKLPAYLTVEGVQHLSTSKAKRPPPPKSFIAAQKFLDSVAPHELSTIAEADSLITSKPSMIEENRKSSTPPLEEIKEYDKFKDEKFTKDQQQVQEKCESPKETSTDVSVPDILTEIIKDAKENLPTEASNQPKEVRKISPKKIINRRRSTKSASTLQDKDSTDASSDKSDLETIETMLQTLGMSWAITTIRKTQQALAHTSSTSSLDISIKKKELKMNDSGSSSSEISLQGVLHKQLLSQITSSSTSDSEMMTLLREFGEISAIHGSSNSAENKNQRTSTPVFPSKNSSKSKSNSQANLFTGESDLSSVRPIEENYESLAVDESNESILKND